MDFLEKQFFGIIHKKNHFTLMYILTLCHVKSSTATTPPEKFVWTQTSRIAAEKTTAPITTAAAKELAATTGTGSARPKDVAAAATASYVQ